MVSLTEKRIKFLCLGSTFLATGGGFPLKAKTEEMLDLGRKKKMFLVGVDELEESDCLCAVSSVGSAAEAGRFEIENILKTGLAEMEKIINQKIKAVIPGELGIENIIFKISSLLNLPVLDGDTAGRRAVPEMSHDTFFVAGESILPAVIISAEGKIKILSQKGGDFLAEQEARQMAVQSSPPVSLIFSHGRPAGSIKKIIALNSLGLSVKIGRLLNSRSLLKINAGIKKLLKGKIIGQGKVTAVSAQNRKGFLFKTAEIKTGGGVLELIIKNEALAVLENGRIKSVIPDSICLLEPETLRPVHSSEIKIGSKLIVFEIPAIPQWKTERGINLFGENYLNGILKNAAD